LLYKNWRNENWKQNIIAIQDLKENVSSEEKIDAATGKEGAINK